MNESADVTLYIVLKEGSTVNYNRTLVSWDDEIVLTAGGLPVEYTQNVGLSEDAEHSFSFRCEWSEVGSSGVGQGMIPVSVKEGKVSADLVVDSSGGITIM